MTGAVAVVAVVAVIAWWLLAAPLRWSPFRTVREDARARDCADG